MIKHLKQIFAFHWWIFLILGANLEAFLRYPAPTHGEGSSLLRKYYQGKKAFYSVYSKVKIFVKTWKSAKCNQEKSAKWYWQDERCLYLGDTVWIFRHFQSHLVLAKAFHEPKTICLWSCMLRIFNTVFKC